MKVQQLFENISEFENKIKEKYNLTTFFVFERPDSISLNMIEVPKADRKAGVGTAVMNDLIEYADNTGKRILLTPGLQDARHGTTSRTRLVKFYKRFGFVENKGRNKDFQISDGMYREPQ